MTNRREFLQAAAITGLPLIAGAAGAIETPLTPASALPDLDLHAVLVDARHPVARSLGTQLARSGATVHSMDTADVTQIWLSRIGPVWRRGPAAVAGLTARPALFCLEQLALASGLRVVFHAEHVVHAGGHVEHSLLRGSDLARLSVRDLERAGTLWPARIAEAMATHRQAPGLMRPGPSSAGLEPTMPAGAQLLTSWIIAA